MATDGIANRNRRGLDDRPRDAGAAGGVWHVMGGADIIRQALAARLVDELSNPDEP